MKNVEMKCLVVIMNGLDSLNMQESANSADGKKLIVDISDDIEKYESLGHIGLNKRIDRYIKETEFIGTKVITLSELLTHNDLKIKRIIRSNLSKILGEGELINRFESSKITNIIVTILGVTILYFFYHLGYAFLYGFYFGGEYSDFIPIIDIFINPVPFNFNSIVVAGVFLLIYNTMIFLPLIRMLFANNIKEIIGLSFLLSISIFISALSCSIIFTGSDILSKNIIGFILILVVIPLIIFFMLLFIKKSLNEGITFVSYMFWYILIFVVVFSRYNIGNYLGLIFLVGMFTVPIIISIIINFISTILKKFHNTKIYLVICDMLKFLPFMYIITVIITSIFQKNILGNELCVLMICFLILIVGVVFKNYSTLNRNKKRLDGKGTSTSRDKDNNKVNKFIFYFLSVFVMIALVYLSAIVPYLLISTGRIVRSSLVGLSKEKIIYSESKNTETKTIIGNLVAQKDGIYYISKYPGRKLVSIKSNNLATFPLEAFTITETIPSKIQDIEVMLTDKYDKKINHPNIISKVEISDMVNDPIDEFKFLKEIYIKLNTSNDESIQYDNGIKILIDYDFNIDGSLNTFELIFGHILSNKIDNDSNQLYDILKDIIGEYKQDILKVFQIPIDIENLDYYYSNGVLKLTTHQEREWYIEKYSLDKYLE